MAQSKPLPVWRQGTRLKRCNRFPTVWAAIIGCKGERVPFWRYTVGAFGHRVPEYACPCCQEFDVKSNGPNRQQVLEEAQRAAGVADYRTVCARVIDGIPTLIRDAQGNLRNEKGWE